MKGGQKANTDQKEKWDPFFVAWAPCPMLLVFFSFLLILFPRYGNNHTCVTRSWLVRGARSCLCCTACCVLSSSPSPPFEDVAHVEDEGTTTRIRVVRYDMSCCFIFVPLLCGGRSTLLATNFVLKTTFY